LAYSSTLKIEAIPFSETYVSDELRGFTAQKIVLLIVTDVGTSNKIFIPFYGSQPSGEKILVFGNSN
jgi:hypothetical protein